MVWFLCSFLFKVTVPGDRNSQCIEMKSVTSTAPLNLLPETLPRQKRGSLIRPVQLPAYLLEHARLAGYGAVDSLFVSCVEVWP